MWGKSARFEAEDISFDPDSVSWMLCDLDLGKSLPSVGCSCLIYTIGDLN